MAAVALCACGDNSAAPVPHSGSRLRQIDYVFDDGTRTAERTSFFDGKMKETCAPTEFADGARYCMPASASAEAVFVDDQCSQALGYVVAGDSAPNYFVGTYVLHGERRPSRLYRAGARTEPPRLVWWLEDTHCLGPDLAKSGTYFEVGDEVTTDELVRIREGERIAGARLEVGVDASDDGLFAFGAVYDALLGACDLVAYPGEDHATCIPRDTQVVSFFGDAQCTQPIVRMSGATAIQQAVWFDTTSDCATLLDVGGPIQLTSVFERIDGRCVRGALAPDSETYATRPAENTLASMKRVFIPSGRRMSLQDLVDGSLRMPGERLFDHDLDAECALESVEGELRCVPLASADTKIVFADSSCTTTVELAFVHTGACDPPARFAGHFERRNRIKAPYTQLLYQLDTGDTCGVLPAPPGYTPFTVDPALLPDQMAAVVVDVQR